MMKRFKRWIALSMVMIMMYSGEMSAYAEIFDQNIESEPETENIELLSSWDDLEDTIANGNCGVDGGDNVVWKLYSDGELWIGGYGAMDDYTDKDTPWEGKSIRSIHFINAADTDNGITYIGAYAFADLDLLNNVVFEPGTCAEKLTIGNGAFYHCDRLTEIYLPEYITKIGEQAFCWCEKLTDIKFPESLAEIGASAFDHCNSLKTVKLPQSLCTLDANAFCCCDGLTSVQLPKDLTMINAGVFSFCQNLTEVQWPENLQIIGSNAFCGCGNLKELQLPEGVIEIKNNAFQLCGLKNIVLPETLQKIGMRAFEDCTLEGTIIPQSVTSIGSEAFEHIGYIKVYPSSYALEYVLQNHVCAVIVGQEDLHQFGNFTWEVTETCLSIEGSGAMPEDMLPSWNQYRSSIQKIVITGSDISLYKNCFNHWPELKEVELDGTKLIGDYAFYYCKKLQSIKLGGVRQIGDYAFYECTGLEKVTSAESVVTIGYRAFLWCSTLTSIQTVCCKIKIPKVAK